MSTKDPGSSGTKAYITSFSKETQTAEALPRGKGNIEIMSEEIY